MSQENVEKARRSFRIMDAFVGRVDADAVERGLNDATLAEFFDPEIEWVPVSQSLLATHSYRGYQGLRDFWSAFRPAWDQYRIEPIDLIDAGDRVVAVFRMFGRTEGLEIDEVWSSVFEFRRGRIMRLQNFNERDGASREVTGRGEE